MDKVRYCNHRWRCWWPCNCQRQLLNWVQKLLWSIKQTMEGIVFINVVSYEKSRSFSNNGVCAGFLRLGAKVTVIEKPGSDNISVFKFSFSDVDR